jgi:hypothetical protein
MRTLRFSIQFGSPGLDLNMPNSQVLQMPMKLGLKFMPIISPDRLDAKRELRDYVIDKIYGILLRMVIINL